MKSALGEGAKTVGGLETGQRRTEADERRIKDQDNRMRTEDAMFNLGSLKMSSHSFYR